MNSRPRLTREAGNTLAPMSASQRRASIRFLRGGTRTRSGTAQSTVDPLERQERQERQEPQEGQELMGSQALDS